MDIEGYECKALQPEVLLGRTGKTIPYIFLEWMALVRAGSGTYLELSLHLQKPRPEQSLCPEYHRWKHLFWAGGYSPHTPGEGRGRRSRV